MRGRFLQLAEIANEDALELCAIRKALRLTEFVNNVVGIGQCVNSSLCNLVCRGQVCVIRGRDVQLDEPAEDNSLIV